MSRRARNNIVKLSWDSRSLICELLDEGVEYDEIRNNPDVAAECKEKSLTLHNSTFLAYSEGAEFLEYRRRSHEWNDTFKRRQVAARMLDDANSADHLAKVADYELMKICVEELEAGTLEPKDLASVSRAVANFNRNRLAAKKEDTRREAAEKEALYQAEIAKLAATIKMMSNRDKNVNTTKVADDLDAALGVR